MTVQETTTSFNPTMVRLLQNRKTDAKISLDGFNPTMVRLLLRLRVQCFSDRLCFNPTMVRLLRVQGLFGCGRFPLFQSHNGAIAAQEELTH